MRLLSGCVPRALSPICACRSRVGECRDAVVRIGTQVSTMRVDQPCYPRHSPAKLTRIEYLNMIC